MSAAPLSGHLPRGCGLTAAGQVGSPNDGHRHPGPLPGHQQGDWAPVTSQACLVPAAPHTHPHPLPHSLGHGAPWQPFVSRPLPLQALPPIWGTGELQRRIRVMLPSPQVTEQEDHGDQWLQPPSCRTSTQEMQGSAAGPQALEFACHPGWRGGDPAEPRDKAGCHPGRAAVLQTPDPQAGDTAPQGRPAADTHCGCHTCPGCTPASGWTAPGRCCW